MRAFPYRLAGTAVLGAGLLVLVLPPARAAYSPPWERSHVAEARLSPGEIARVARARREVIAIQDEYRDRLRTARSARAQNTVMGRVNKAEVAAVRGEGLSVAAYSRILDHARVDPTLRKELLAGSGTGRG